ncbi:ankyrin repeat-containing domain protein [Xylariaceae sp. FL1651]|nr:ankyrin repeat-containing domain protein [Xylariaceae sp. FL1651]
MPDPHDYTIGWVCAIDKEHVAARAFLDEEHADPDFLPVHDNNAYTLGRIGKHNVVIAVLPHREYGLVSAANVARDMIRSFPNLRLGLMVGIGGGAPAKHDIRLGDVVVSSAGYGNGGVFQYDYGKSIQNKAFVPTGFLNKPPTFVMTAVSTLMNSYRMKGHRFQESITSVLDRYPRLQDEYQRPAASTDRLYKPDAIHVTDDESCATSCGDDESKLILRSSRLAKEDDPAIHYGLIASANQLMKDALIRDKLSAEKDVLCFEMEAAGLMNQFPFLIVRGICDYSDTHKNSLWQGYAAMTAAAYTKDLLYKIAPNKVEAERRLGETLLDVQEDIKQVKAVVENLTTDVHYDRISTWLSPPDPSTNLNNSLRNRHPGSGQWFLDHPAYLSWISESNSFLWLYGIPGCGKTILTSTIAEDIIKKRASQDFIYFYFDFNDTSKQNLDMMLRSFVSQLYNQNKNVRNHLDMLYSSYNQGKHQPSSESLHAAFRDMIQQAGEIWIVIDALDECNKRHEYPAGGLLSWIQSLQGHQPNIHLLVTSRPEQDINAAIKSWAREQDIISIQSDLVSEDINAYVCARVREYGPLSKRWHTKPEIQDEIEDALIKKADGMFRLASCQLDELEGCLRPPDVREALANLPKTLDEMYTRIIGNILPKHKPIATRILQFLTFSDSPLSLDEAIDIITVNTSTCHFNPTDRMPCAEEILYYCSSLVIIVERKDNFWEQAIVKSIQLSHFSVKEYLVSNRLEQDVAQDFEITTANASLTNVCLIYLLGIEHNRPAEVVHRLYPLALHAARYWTGYAIAANNSKLLVSRLIADLLVCRAGFRMCCQLYPPEGMGVEPPSALYYASSSGFIQAVKLLLDEGADINTHGGAHGTALEVASVKGHENIVRILLDKYADINSGRWLYRTALYTASFKGYENIVRILLDKNADIDSRAKNGSTALHAASYNGHENIVRILLDKGANVNDWTRRSSIALYAASSNGYENIVRILLDKGANVNDWSGRSSSALYAASYNGHENIVRILLDKGANISDWTGHSSMALYAASSNGHENIVRILLDKGADVNDWSGRSSSALYAASSNGHENIVRILLDKGANVNDWSGRGSMALYAASSNRHENIVRILLDEGADVNAQSPEYGSALQVASYKGHEHLVQAPLDGGAIPDTPFAMKLSGPNVDDPQNHKDRLGKREAPYHFNNISFKRVKPDLS